METRDPLLVLAQEVMQNSKELRQRCEDNFFAGEASLRFLRTRDEILAARVPRIALFANFDDRTSNERNGSIDLILRAYLESTLVGCAEPHLLIGGTDVDSQRGSVSTKTRVADTTSELSDILLSYRTFSAPLDLGVAASSVAEFNRISSHSFYDAAVFIVAGRHEVDAHAVDAFALAGRRTPTFIIHSVPAKAAYCDSVQEALSRCTKAGHGLYISYPENCFDILSDHLESIVTFATGIPSIVRGRVERASTPEGKMFAAKLAAPFANLSF